MFTTFTALTAAFVVLGTALGAVLGYSVGLAVEALRSEPVPIPVAC